MDRYQIEHDRDAGAIRYRIEGFWDVATVEAFGAELLAAVAKAQASGRKLDMIGDATGFAVQTAPVAAAFETLMMERVVPKIRRLAVVVGAMLNKLQVERGAAGDQVRVFLNEEQAQAWLKETK